MNRSPAAPRPVPQWLPLYQQESDFLASIEEGEVSRTPRPGDIEAGTHALRCHRCQNYNVIAPCRHCGGTHFTLKRTAYGQIALYCRACTRPYDHTACSCGTVIPPSSKALFKQVLIQPMASGVLLRWAAIGLLGIIVLILLFKTL